MRKLLANHWLLIIVIIIAAFLRFYNLTLPVDGLPPGLYPDEAMNGNNALEALSTGHFKVFYPENNGREGLFINIQAVFLKIFGVNEPWVLRLPSAIFGILTVLGLYFLAKELFGEKIALLSSFFLAASFWHINFSRIGFRAIMAPFFAVWAIYFLLLALRQIKEQKSPKFYILNSILAGIFYGLGFYSYIAYRATPLLILIVIGYWLLVNKEWQIRKKILLATFCFLISTFIVAAPLGLYFLQNPQDFFGRTTQISIFNSPTPIKDLGFNILKTAGMFNFIGDWNWRHNYAGRPELFWPVGILFIVGIILGIKSILRKDFPKLPFLILFAWLIITALPVIISNEGQPHALRAILMAPAVFILAGIGGIWLTKKIKNQISKIKIANQNSKILSFIIHTSLFIILSLFVFEAYTTYFIKWGQNPNTYAVFNADYVQIGRDLNNLPKELQKYVVVEATGIDVRGIPMPAQTVMFITDTFTSEKQKDKNIYYVLPNQISQIPLGSYVFILK